MDVRRSLNGGRRVKVPRPAAVAGAVQFAVLASGSRGNSTLVRGQGAGLLIDAGIGPKALAERLESVGASWSLVAAAVITHTHSDHIDSGTFNELARRGVLVHCHEAHRAELKRDGGFQKLEEAGLVRCYDERPFLTAAGHRLEPIELRHDGGPTYGFRIEAAARRNDRPISLGYLADTGCWSERMAESLTDVDVLGVEFNHDVAMQRASRRPEFLIERNLSDDGHLSNMQGAELIRAVLNRSRERAVRHVVLLHLSEQCNQPELAVLAAEEAVRALGRQVKIHAARQSPAFPNLWITPGRRAAGSPSINRTSAQPGCAAECADSPAGAAATTGLFAWLSDPDEGSGEIA